MPRVNGQSEHLRPHAHAPGATITLSGGKWEVSCCNATSQTLAGLGERECPRTAAPKEAA
jgi:hypothetical protein